MSGEEKEELCFFCGKEISTSTSLFSHEFDTLVHVRCLIGRTIKALREGIIDAELRCILSEFGVSMRDIYKARRSLLFPNTNRGGLSPSEVWIDEEVPAPEAKVEGNEFMGYTVTPLADPAGFIRKYQSQSRAWRKACEGAATVSKEEAEQAMKKYDEFFQNYIMNMPPTVGNFGTTEFPGDSVVAAADSKLLEELLQKFYTPERMHVKEIWLLPDLYREMCRWVAEQEPEVMGYIHDPIASFGVNTIYGIPVHERYSLPPLKELEELFGAHKIFRPIVQDGVYKGLMFYIDPKETDLDKK